MFKLQIRNIAPFLLLAVFIIFFGIALLHPFSHEIGHHEGDGHECPICLWLYYAAAIVLFIFVFYSVLRFIGSIDILPAILSAISSIITYISRAPPSRDYYSNSFLSY